MNKYIKIPRDKIEFYGDTEKEKKVNELIYDLSLEIDSLQQEKKQLEEVIDEAIDMLNLIIPELWNINNYMTCKVQKVRGILERYREDHNE